MPATSAAAVDRIDPGTLIVPDWPAPANVRALVTTRAGGVSCGPWASLNLGLRAGDDALCVEENRRRLREHLPAAPRWLQQVHGVQAVAAHEVSEPPPADASFTDRARVVCTVMIADCMPVLLCADDGSRVAAVHCGWRGLSGGALENAIAALRIDAQHLLAWLGPAIGPQAFEVGDDVRDAFLAVDPQAGDAFRAAPTVPGKWYTDLFALGRQRLARAGVARVYGGGLCTFADPLRFFSYRRDRTTGRMAALIWSDG